MKKSCRISLLVTGMSLFSSALLFAAPAENQGPKIIDLKMGKQEIKFTHHKHQQLTKNQCWECHDTSKGKIPGWGKEKAHKLCIPCHDLNEKGPVSCKGCHKK